PYTTLFRSDGQVPIHFDHYSSYSNSRCHRQFGHSSSPPLVLSLVSFSERIDKFRLLLWLPGSVRDRKRAGRSASSLGEHTGLLSKTGKGLHYDGLASKR